MYRRSHLPLSFVDVFAIATIEALGIAGFLSPAKPVAQLEPIARRDSISKREPVSRRESVF